MGLRSLALGGRDLGWSTGFPPCKLGALGHLLNVFGPKSSVRQAVVTAPLPSEAPGRRSRGGAGGEPGAPYCSGDGTPSSAVFIVVTVPGPSREDRGPGKGLFDGPLGYSLMQAGRGRCAEGVTLPPGGRLCSSAPAAELTGQKQGPGWRFLPRGALARVSWEEALAKARSPGHGPESEGRKGTPHRGSL